jgi:hypothetical protein
MSHWQSDHYLSYSYAKVCFILRDSRAPTECVRDCLENSTLLGQPLAKETIKIQSVACRSVCRRGRIKQTFAFSKETVECLHLIFWPGSQRRVHCRTAKPEANRRVTIDRVPLLGNLQRTLLMLPQHKILKISSKPKSNFIHASATAL